MIVDRVESHVSRLVVRMMNNGLMDFKSVGGAEANNST